jgi:hypothetical protein
MKSQLAIPQQDIVQILIVFSEIGGGDSKTALQGANKDCLRCETNIAIVDVKGHDCAIIPETLSQSHSHIIAHFVAVHHERHECALLHNILQGQAILIGVNVDSERH